MNNRTLEKVVKGAMVVTAVVAAVDVIYGLNTEKSLYSYINQNIEFFDGLLKVDLPTLAIDYLGVAFYQRKKGREQLYERVREVFSQNNLNNY